MIKIRYRDPNELSPGLHAEAERHGRCTTVYLLSGLTAAERRAALRRLRLSARMGYCPPLPAAQLALALLADRVRTGAGQAGAVFRLHPAGSTLPVMVLSAGAIAFLLLSTVSIHVLRPPRALGRLQASGAPPVASASAVPVLGTSRDPGAGGLGQPGRAGFDSGQVTRAPAGSAGSQADPAPGVVPGAGGAPGSGNGTTTGTTGGGPTGTTGGPTGTTGGSGTTGTTGGTTGTTGGSGTTGGTTTTGSGTTGGGTTGGGTTGSGTTGSGTTGSGSSNSGSASGGSGTPAAASTQAAAPSTSAAAAPQPTPAASSNSGVCVDVGPLGVCLKL